MTLALLLMAVGGAWADQTYTVTFAANNNTKTVENVTLPKTFQCSNANANGELDLILKELFGWTGSADVTYCNAASSPTSSDENNVTAGLDGSYSHYITIKKVFEGTVTITGNYYVNDFGTPYSLKISIAAVAPAGPEVTINEAKTEATFEMPEYDVDLSYELVRDMSVQMQAQVGDGTVEQPRYRVQWNDATEKFVPAELNQEQVMALFSVNDLIEQETLKQGTDYFVSIYAVDAEGNPTGDAMTFQNFTFAPGRYCVTATGLLGGPYDGTTAPSNIFELFQGYQVVIPAGEYVTYYRNEALRVDEADKENFKLYTVSSVSGDKATLSNAFDAAPSNTPFLVYNNTNETKTVLLIPCNEPDLALTVADQFLGTMEEKTFTDADMAAADYYVCNGKQFVKVRGAGTLGANKAYLKFVTDQQLSAPQYISISGDLGEGTTRIDNLNVNDNENGEWYDLNGRKLNGKPVQKGIYIKNGKKVVVH